MKKEKNVAAKKFLARRPFNRTVVARSLGTHHAGLAHYRIGTCFAYRDRFHMQTTSAAAIGNRRASDLQRHAY